MASEKALQMAAQAWTTSSTSRTPFDPVLAQAFAEILDPLLQTIARQAYVLGDSMTPEPLKYDSESMTWTFTFNGLLDYGRAQGANIVKGMPWSFSVHGVPVTHERDDLYIVGREFMSPGDILMIKDGQVSVVHPPVRPTAQSKSQVKRLEAQRPEPENVGEPVKSPVDKDVEVRKALEHLVNCHSLENGSNTPDFLLAEYLWECLKNWDQTISKREAWYGRGPKVSSTGDQA